MLGVPPLSRTPTDVSQHSFGGVLQRGIGTPHTASSVRSYTITTNRIPGVHDMQGIAYGIRDVAPWVDGDFEIPSKPLGGGGSGVRDVAPWVDHEIDGLAPGSRSPILPVSSGDVRQDAVLFLGSGSPASRSKSQSSPGKSLGSLGTENESSPPTSEQREEQREKRKARQRRREVDREKKGKECERRGHRQRLRQPAHRGRRRNRRLPLRHPPFRTPVDPLTDTQWTQLLRLNQHTQRLPQDPARSPPLLLMPDPCIPTPASGPPASGSAPRLFAPPNTPVARWGLGSVAATAAGEGGADRPAASPASATRG